VPPPYPVTILPAFSSEQPAAAPQTLVATVPPQQPVAQTTPATQEALPQTGSSLDLWWLAALLAVTVIVVGFARRRLRAQTVGRDAASDETTHSKE
jgi:anti-sigma-K factor RskA